MNMSTTTVTPLDINTALAAMACEYCGNVLTPNELAAITETGDMSDIMCDACANGEPQPAPAITDARMALEAEFQALQSENLALKLKQALDENTALKAAKPTPVVPKAAVVGKGKGAKQGVTGGVAAAKPAVATVAVANGGGRLAPPARGENQAGESRRVGGYLEL